VTLPCTDPEIDLRRFECTTESRGIRICARWHAIGIARPKGEITGIAIAFVARMMIERINFPLYTRIFTLSGNRSDATLKIAFITCGTSVVKTALQQRCLTCFLAGALLIHSLKCIPRIAYRAEQSFIFLRYHRSQIDRRHMRTGIGDIFFFAIITNEI